MAEQATHWSFFLLSLSVAKKRRRDSCPISLSHADVLVLNVEHHLHIRLRRRRGHREDAGPRPPEAQEAGASGTARAPPVDGEGRDAVVACASFPTGGRPAPPRELAVGAEAS